MDKSLRNWRLIGAAVLVSVAVVLVVLIRRDEAPRTPAPPERPAHAPEATMEGMRASEFRQGVKRWDLAAEQAVYDRDSNRTRLQRVTLQVAGKPPRGMVTLTAPQAEFQNASKNLLLPAGVQATGDRRLSFSAGSAVFSNASGLLTGRDHVRYADELLQVEGEEMVFVVETRDLRIRRNVRATIAPRAVSR